MSGTCTGTVPGTCTVLVPVVKSGHPSEKNPAKKMEFTKKMKNKITRQSPNNFVRVLYWLHTDAPTYVWS